MFKACGQILMVMGALMILIEVLNGANIGDAEKDAFLGAICCLLLHQIETN